MRESIIMYDSWGLLIRELPEAQAAELCKMIFAYSFCDEEPVSSDPAINAMFAMIREKLDEDAEAWAETKRRRSEGGKKGMESRWHNSVISNDNSVITNHNSVKEVITPITVSESVSVSVSNKDKEKDKRESRRFTPPSLQEVSEYVREKGYHVDPQAFIDFYTSKGWKVGNQTMKDWRAAIRTWERREKKTHRGNKFNQFEQNTYDYDELERQLISN